MIKAILLLSILSQTAISTSLCKETIIEFYSMVGKDVKAQDFSSISNFSEVGLTTEEFNALETEEQKVYFDKLMPIQMKAKNTLSYLNYLADGIRETLARIYLYQSLGPYTKLDVANMMKNLESLVAFEKKIEICTISDFSEAFKTSLFKIPELTTPVLQSRSISM